MADTFEIKHGDTRPELIATLYSDSAMTVPVDLTNATSVKIKVGDGQTTVKLDKTMTIKTPATDGKVGYQFTVTDWSAVAPGDHDMEFEVTWNDTTISTYPKTGYKTLKVNPDLDV